MDPRLRQALVTTAAAVLAVWLGINIAEGEFLWPGVFAALAACAVLVRLFSLSIDVILCGWVVFGYIVGNRGFAQLMPAPGLPLLPAEIALLVAGGWRFVSAAFARRLPFVPDALNWVLLGWLALGGVRLLFDVPGGGFVAIRDSAVVYYALFFFLVQEMARDPAARRYLVGCALAGVIVVVPMYALYSLFPDLFLRHLTVRGVPLIFYKGDLLNSYFAIGSLLVFFHARGRWALPAWALSAGMFIFVAGGENRASLFGLLLACGFLALGRRWRFPLLQGGVSLFALMVALALATAHVTWAENKLHGLSDRVRSLVDFQGRGTYQSDEAFNKGDNNRFRLVWWSKVIDETWALNPVFGRGFGADLAAGFVQEYYPDAEDEFSTRSPHNVFITVFGRTGFVGLAVWLTFCVTLAIRTLRSVRHDDDPPKWALWASAWVLLGSATFGVVLEGPMGAVPFWVMLGLANARLGALPSGDTIRVEDSKPQPLAVPS